MWDEEDLRLIGWQWAGNAMKFLNDKPDMWKAWADHANLHISTQTTDSKVANALREFVTAQGYEGYKS